jgi:hypothetical protein
LEKKPDGCVIWIVFDPDTLKLGPFLWLGAPAGQPLPPLGDRVARHAEADSTGMKAPRPNPRVVSKKSFEELDKMEEVVEALFGPLRGK